MDSPYFFVSASADEAAATIASASGDSGSNHEYLFSLWDYLEKASEATKSPRREKLGSGDVHWLLAQDCLARVPHYSRHLALDFSKFKRDVYTLSARNGMMISVGIHVPGYPHNRG